VLVVKKKRDPQVNNAAQLVVKIHPSNLGQLVKFNRKKLGESLESETQAAIKLI
jgi:hypothetical protein